MNDLTFEQFTDILKRFLNKPKHWFGDITIKFYRGEIANVKAKDSYDLEILKGSKLKINNMFKKTGSPNKEDEKSSKILSQIIIEDGKIKKEAKIEAKEVEEENNKQMENKQ